MHDHDKVLTLDALTTERRRLRQEGKTVVQCHGCFDIVHPGHIRYLRFAKELGDVLIVTISGDTAVNKGFDRPYIVEQLRAENLAALSMVDYVCIDHNDWAGPVLEALEPDVYVKGKEYEQGADPRFLRERKLVEDQGGRVVFSSGDVVFSSTHILSQRQFQLSVADDKAAAFCTRHDLDSLRLGAALDEFVGKRVLVIADGILDRYRHCESAEVAAEGPVLSVTPLGEHLYAGGGALLATQLAALGGAVELMTARLFGDGLEDFKDQLQRMDVVLTEVGSDLRPLYRKTRFLVGGQKVFKVNEGRHAPLSTAGQTALLQAVAERIQDVDAVVAMDFGQGLFSAFLCEGLADMCDAHERPFFVDVSSHNRTSVLKFQRPTLATPTEDELRFALGDRESGISNLASRYYQATQARGLIVTLAHRGAILFHPPQAGQPRLRTDYLPAMQIHPIDPVGAGDVFLSGQVIAHLVGASMALGLYLGSCLSALHISRVGNACSDARDLRELLNRRPELMR